MRILKISKNKTINEYLEFFILSCCSFLLLICIYKPGTLAAIIQGDVGGWINPSEHLLSSVASTRNENEVNKSNVPIKVGNEKRKVINSEVGKRLASIAKDYSNRREICSRKPESCAKCIRVILKEGKCNYKIVSSNPLDGWKKPYGPLYANSLWGKDIGQVKGKDEEILPGDLLFFENTYKGNWWNKLGYIPKDNYNTGKQSFTHVVTHIEIATDSKRMVGKRSAYKPMSEVNIRTRFGNKFLGSITLYADLCNSNS